MWPAKLQLANLDTLFEVTFSETVVGATFLARLFSIPRSEGGMRVPHQHSLVQHLVRGVGAELHDLLVRDPHQAVPLPLRLHRCKTVRCSEHSAASFFLLMCCLLRRSLVSALLDESLCLVYSRELFRLSVGGKSLLVGAETTLMTFQAGERHGNQNRLSDRQHVIKKNYDAFEFRNSTLKASCFEFIKFIFRRSAAEVGWRRNEL